MTHSTAFGAVLPSLTEGTVRQWIEKSMVAISTFGLTADNVEVASTTSSGSLVHHLVSDLGDQGLVVVKPFPVVVEALEDDNYVAKCSSPNINASGDDTEDAIANWKNAAKHKLTYYESLPRDRLSIGARKTLDAIRAHLS